MLLALLGGLSLQEEALPLDLGSLIPPSARFVWKQLPDHRNAYPALLKLDERSSSQWVREFLDDRKSAAPRDLIRKSETDARAMDQALARSRFQWPKPEILAWFPRPEEPLSNMPPTLSVSTMARFRAARAEAFSRLKQVDRAIGEVEAIFKLAKGAGSGNPLAIQYLFAATADGIASRSLGDLVKTHRLTHRQIARLRKAVGPALTVDPDLALMARVELNMFTRPEYERVPLQGLLTLDPLLMFSGFPGAEKALTADQVWPVNDPDLLDRRKTFSLLAQSTARALPDLSRPWPRRNRKSDNYLQAYAQMAPDRPWEEQDREPRKEEVAAFRRAAERVPNAFGLFKLRDAGEYDMPQVALKRLTYRALALATLALEEGTPRLPLDPATLKPLRYDPKTRTLYSVGPNEKDERGRGDDVRMAL